MTLLKPRPVRWSSGRFLNYPHPANWKRDQVVNLLAVLGRPPSPEPFALYLNIPFCQFPCRLCEWKIYPVRQDGDRCVEALLKEFEKYGRHPQFAGRQCNAIYFGGGSPSYLDVGQLEKLLGQLRQFPQLSSPEEITFECTPTTVDKRKLESLHRLGVTRLVFGLETFTDPALRASCRDWTAKDSARAFQLARAAGFTSIQLDLTAGLVSETHPSWVETVRQALELKPDSISFQSIDKPTHWKARATPPCAGSLLDLTPELSRHDWVVEALQLCEKSGSAIVNAHTVARTRESWRSVFVEDDFWGGRDVLALGQAAFGHLQGVLYQNADSFGGYRDSLAKEKFPIERALRLHPEERWRRAVILGFKSGRLDLAKYRKQLGVDLLAHFFAEFQALESLGFLNLSEGEIHLTSDGLAQLDRLSQVFVSNHPWETSDAGIANEIPALSSEQSAQKRQSQLATERTESTENQPDGKGEDAWISPLAW